MPVPLEDGFQDVVGKAVRGLRLNESQLASQAGVSADEVETFKRGGKLVDCAATEKIAAALGLEAPGYRMLANMGVDGGQEVAHFHVHLFGGGPLGPMLSG